MTTTPNPVYGERENSLERELRLGRLKKVQTFINDVLKPADTTMGEQKAQRDEVQKFESRPYQLEAWDALWQAREQGQDRGLIHLATGLGKTSVAVFDYAKFRKEQEAKGEPARALFVVHQNAILDQADERFNEVLPHLLPGVGMSRFSNQSDTLPTGEVVFASFQSLNRGAHKFNPTEFDYIVYDEAHHIEAKTYKKVVEYFQPKFQLGLTATPERGDEKDITQHFGEALYTKTLPEGIAEGYLADVHYRLMLDEQTKKLLQNGFKPKSMQELTQIFDFKPKLGDVAAAIKEAQQELRDKTGLEKVKTIIFDPDIATADEMAQLMDGVSYHSAKGKDNVATLKAFRGGDLETIVTRDMFNEGVDIPDALLIVFRRSTQSKTIFEQQLGRGLRKTDQKDTVTVLDFVANAERIRLLKELAKEIHEKRLNTTRGERKTSDESTDDADSHLSISAGGSEFVFDQQIIDILALYDYFQEKNSERVDWSTWTNEELIELAKQLSPDKPMTTADINEFSKKNEFLSITTIINRFPKADGSTGSLIPFLQACGFEIEERVDWSTWTNEELIELAKQLSPDKPMTTADINEFSKKNEFTSMTDIQFRFGGSINNFRRACGYEVEDAPDGVLSLGNFASILDIHSATLKVRIKKLGFKPDDLPIFSFNGYRARGISVDLQKAVIESASPDTSIFKPFSEIIRVTGIHKFIAHQYLKQYMPYVPKMKFGNVDSYALTQEDEQAFLSIPKVSHLISLEQVPNSAKSDSQVASALGTTTYILNKFLATNNIIPNEYRNGGRIVKQFSAEQQDSISKLWAS